MIELETMLMQFCLEASGRLNGDRGSCGWGWLAGGQPLGQCAWPPEHSVARGPQGRKAG